jgi:hypothetical protein
MRPGHPAVLAELPDGRFVVGLPGNPLAAMMALTTLAEPSLAALGNRSLIAVGQAISGADIDPDRDRTRLIPCKIVHGLAFPISHTGPGMMRGLAWGGRHHCRPPQEVPRPASRFLCSTSPGRRQKRPPLPQTTGHGAHLRTHDTFQCCRRERTFKSGSRPGCETGTLSSTGLASPPSPWTGFGATLRANLDAANSNPMPGAPTKSAGTQLPEDRTSGLPVFLTLDSLGPRVG